MLLVLKCRCFLESGREKSARCASSSQYLKRTLLSQRGSVETKMLVEGTSSPFLSSLHHPGDVEGSGTAKIHFFPLSLSLETGNDCSGFQMFLPRWRKSQHASQRLLRSYVFCVPTDFWLFNPCSRARSYQWKKFFTTLGQNSIK